MSDVAEAVETPEEVARLAAEPGPEERYVDADDETVAEGYWRIEDLGGLDWALSRIADLEREQAENAEIVGAQIDRLRARLEKLNAQAERGLRFFRSQVAAYAEAHRAELLGGGKKKSRALPSGVIGWKKVPAKAVVTDEAALLEWARSQPVELELVRITEKPAWSDIKKQIEATGEVLPGTDYQPEGEALTIKTEASK